MRLPLHRAGVLGFEQRLQDGEVVLEVVDGTHGIARRRPREAGAALGGGIGGQCPVVANAPGDGADDVEGIEGRHARTHVAHLAAQSRIREVQALGGGADREPQEQPFGRRPICPRHQVGARLAAHIVEQQRILADALRKCPLSQTGHEYDAEGAPPQLVRRADEHATVTLSRRLPLERQQTILQHVPRFLERHGADRRHGPQSREHLQHPRRTLKDLRRESGKCVQPLPPCRPLGPASQRVDDRQRERAQMTKIAQVALEASDAWRVRFFAPQFREAKLVLRRQPVKPATPPPLAVDAVHAADHRRLDDQLFPFPRRPQRPGNDRLVVRIGYAVWRDEVGRRIVVRRRSEARVRLVVGHGRKTGRATLANARNLTEREVFIEAPRRQLLAGARQERHERASGRIRASRTAIEMGGHSGARERVLEQTQILLRRAQTHGHLVEWDTGRRFVERPSGNLERLARFAWRREQTHVAGRRRRRRRIEHEDATPQSSEIGVCRCIVLDVDGLQAQSFERGKRRLVANGAGDKRIARASQDRRHKSPFRDRIERNVEHQGRTTEPANPSLPHGCRRDEQRRPIVDAGRVEAAVKRVEQPADVRRARARAGQHTRRRRRQAAVHESFAPGPWEIPASTPQDRSTRGRCPQPRRRPRAPPTPRG